MPVISVESSDPVTIFLYCVMSSGMVVTDTPAEMLPSARSRGVTRPSEERAVTPFAMVNVASDTRASVGVLDAVSSLNSQSVVVYLPP